jgi:1-acyl-sn-glycerol-3-phosphate acyltransferase
MPFIAFFTLLFGLLAIVAGLIDPRGGLSRALGRAWARSILLTLGVVVDVAGAEHAPAGPAVYAANHGSALDIPILLAHLPADFRIIHKRSLYLIPVLGWSLWFAGHIGIDRSRPFRARRSLEAAARMLREGASLAVFPEGTRSPDADVRPFKRGSFVLATEAGAPVVPVSLAGVKRVVPRGIGTLRPGAVRMTIHPPVETAGRPPHGASALAEEVRLAVAAGCREV